MISRNLGVAARVEILSFWVILFEHENRHPFLFEILGLMIIQLFTREHFFLTKDNTKIYI